MTVERKQTKLAKNSEDMERWIGRMLRAANEVRRLRDQRKRLLKPKTTFDHLRDAPAEAKQMLDDAIGF